MKILLCIISILFGLLSIIAALSQIKNTKRRLSPRLMILGGALLILAVLGMLLKLKADWIIAFAGNALICGAAIYNGLSNDNFHLQHHIIRIALSVLLVTGFMFL